MTFEPPSTLPSSPPAWDATNVALLGWPTVLGVNQQVVLKAPDVAVLATIGRQKYDDACLAEHPRLEQANPANLTASDLTYQLWIAASDATSSAFANSSDYVGQHPPPGLVLSGEDGAPTEVVLSCGTFIWTPEQKGTYTVWLLAGFETDDGRDPNPTLRAEFGSDSATTQRDDQIVMATWNFEVASTNTFTIESFARTATESGGVKPYSDLGEADGAMARLDCAVGETYRVAPIDPTTIKSNIQALTGNSQASLAYSLTGAPKGFFIGGNAEILAVPTELTVNETNSSEAVWQTVGIIATDPASGLGAVVQTIQIRVRKKDTEIAAYGPNGKDCLNGGTPIDTIEFNNGFACDCSNTRFTVGDNCESEPPAPSGTTGAAVGAVAGVFAALILAVAIGYRYRVRQLSMRAFDFEVQMADMVAKGELELEQVAGGRYPREIKRSNVTTTQVVGAGAFGEVWKAVLDETGQGGVPGYLCAVKTSKDATGEGADELRREALVMAQVVGHQNVVALIGVVTSGVPLMLLLSLCEHGSLQSCLKEKKFASQSKDSGYHAPSTLETLKMAIEIASGMDHLVQASFVHRDLAARNVLLDSQFICKIADFGLSRGIGATDPDNDAAKEYYTSHGGQFPVRWTAPEAIETMKFSTASDLWSYGIVLLEIVTGGKRPYHTLRNNQVIKSVLEGDRAPRPTVGCTEDLYTGVMLKCWDADPKARPLFGELVTILERQLQAAIAADPGYDFPDGHGQLDTTTTGGGGSAREYLTPGVQVGSASAGAAPATAAGPEYELEPARTAEADVDEDGYQRPAAARSGAAASTATATATTVFPNVGEPEYEMAEYDTATQSTPSATSYMQVAATITTTNTAATNAAAAAYSETSLSLGRSTDSMSLLSI